MTIEHRGECSGTRNVKRLKLENTKQYAKTNTAENAKVAMRDAGVRWTERPSEESLKNHRPSKDKNQRPNRTPWTAWVP